MTEQEINELNEKLHAPGQSVRIGSFLWRGVSDGASDSVEMWEANPADLWGANPRRSACATTLFVRLCSGPAVESARAPRLEVTTYTPLGERAYVSETGDIVRCAIEAERELLKKLADTLDMFCSGSSGLLNLVLEMSDCDDPADGSFAQRAGCIATDYVRSAQQLPGAGNMPLDWPGSHEAWEQAQTKPAQARLIAAAAMLVLEADRISKNNTDEQSPTE